MLYSQPDAYVTPGVTATRGPPGPVTPAPIPLAPKHLVVPHSFPSGLRSSSPPHTCAPHRPELHGARQALVPPFPCRRCGAGPAGPAERRQRGESSPLRPAPPGPPLPRASAAMRQQGPRPPAALRRGVRKSRIIPGSPGPSPGPSPSPAAPRPSRRSPTCPPERPHSAPAEPFITTSLPLLARLPVGSANRHQLG